MAAARTNRRRPKPAEPPAAPGRPLPLLSQYDYTSGGCYTFARAAVSLLGGRPALLFAKHWKQFEEHDHPLDEPLCLHAFVMTKEGLAIDAEGIRPVRELARGFGVREGWDYEIAMGKADIAEEFPERNPEAEAIAVALMEEHGWRGGVPEADGSLKRNWRAVQVMRDERAGRKRQPTPEELRLYALVPGHEVKDWHGFERLEIREHPEHGFVIAALPSDPDDDELLVTAAGDLETAEDIACELECESGLSFDLDVPPVPYQASASPSP